MAKYSKKERVPCYSAASISLEHNNKKLGSVQNKDAVSNISLSKSKK